MNTEKNGVTSFLSLHHGAGDRGRTGTVSLPLDFESSTSANSITPAELLTARFIIQYEKRKSKIKMKKL